MKDKNEWSYTTKQCDKIIQNLNALSQRMCQDTPHGETEQNWQDVLPKNQTQARKSKRTKKEKSAKKAKPAHSDFTRCYYLLTHLLRQVQAGDHTNVARVSEIVTEARSAINGYRQLSEITRQCFINVCLSISKALFDAYIEDVKSHFFGRVTSKATVEGLLSLIPFQTTEENLASVMWQDETLRYVCHDFLVAAVDIFSIAQLRTSMPCDFSESSDTDRFVFIDFPKTLVEELIVLMKTYVRVQALHDKSIKRYERIASSNPHDLPQILEAKWEGREQFQKNFTDIARAYCNLNIFLNTNLANALRHHVTNLPSGTDTGSVMTREGLKQQNGLAMRSIISFFQMQKGETLPLAELTVFGAEPRLTSVDTPAMLSQVKKALDDTHERLRKKQRPVEEGFCKAVELNKMMCNRYIQKLDAIFENIEREKDNDSLDFIDNINAPLTRFIKHAVLPLDDLQTLTFNTLQLYYKVFTRLLSQKRITIVPVFGEWRIAVRKILEACPLSQESIKKLTRSSFHNFELVLEILKLSKTKKYHKEYIPVMALYFDMVIQHNEVMDRRNIMIVPDAVIELFTEKVDKTEGVSQDDFSEIMRKLNLYKAAYSGIETIHPDVSHTLTRMKASPSHLSRDVDVQLAASDWLDRRDAAALTARLAPAEPVHRDKKVVFDLMLKSHNEVERLKEKILGWTTSTKSDACKNDIQECYRAYGNYFPKVFDLGPNSDFALKIFSDLRQFQRAFSPIYDYVSDDLETANLYVRCLIIPITMSFLNKTECPLAGDDLLWVLELTHEHMTFFMNRTKKHGLELKKHENDIKLYYKTLNEAASKLIECLPDALQALTSDTIAQCEHEILAHWIAGDTEYANALKKTLLIKVRQHLTQLADLYTIYKGLHVLQELKHTLSQHEILFDDNLLRVLENYQQALALSATQVQSRLFFGTTTPDTSLPISHFSAEHHALAEQLESEDYFTVLQASGDSGNLSTVFIEIQSVLDKDNISSSERASNLIALMRHRGFTSAALELLLSGDDVSPENILVTAIDASTCVLQHHLNDTEAVPDEKSGAVATMSGFLLMTYAACSARFSANTSRLEEIDSRCLFLVNTILSAYEDTLQDALYQLPSTLGLAVGLLHYCLQSRVTANHQFADRDTIEDITVRLLKQGERLQQLYDSIYNELQLVQRAWVDAHNAGEETDACQKHYEGIYRQLVGCFVKLSDFYCHLEIFRIQRARLEQDFEFDEQCASANAFFHQPLHSHLGLFDDVAVMHNEEFRSALCAFQKGELPVNNFETAYHRWRNNTVRMANQSPQDTYQAQAESVQSVIEKVLSALRNDCREDAEAMMTQLVSHMGVNLLFPPKLYPQARFLLAYTQVARNLVHNATVLKIDVTLLSSAVGEDFLKAMRPVHRFLTEKNRSNSATDIQHLWLHAHINICQTNVLEGGAVTPEECADQKYLRNNLKVLQRSFISKWESAVYDYKLSYPDDAGTAINALQKSLLQSYQALERLHCHIEQRAPRGEMAKNIFSWQNRLRIPEAVNVKLQRCTRYVMSQKVVRFLSLPSEKFHRLCENATRAKKQSINLPSVTHSNETDSAEARNEIVSIETIETVDAIRHENDKDKQSELRAKVLSLMKKAARKAKKRKMADKKSRKQREELARLEDNARRAQQRKALNALKRNTQTSKRPENNRPQPIAEIITPRVTQYGAIKRAVSTDVPTGADRVKAGKCSTAHRAQHAASAEKLNVADTKKMAKAVINADKKRQVILPESAEVITSDEVEQALSRMIMTCDELESQLASASKQQGPATAHTSKTVVAGTSYLDLAASSPNHGRAPAALPVVDYLDLAPPLMSYGVTPFFTKRPVHPRLRQFYESASHLIAYAPPGFVDVWGINLQSHLEHLSAAAHGHVGVDCYALLQDVLKPIRNLHRSERRFGLLTAEAHFHYGHALMQLALLDSTLVLHAAEIHASFSESKALLARVTESEEVRKLRVMMDEYCITLEPYLVSSKSDMLKLGQ